MRLPSLSLETALVVRESAHAIASEPKISISPMWLTSNSPTALRTVLCSSMTPEYCTGMSQPPKSTIFGAHCAVYRIEGRGFEGRG